LILPPLPAFTALKQFRDRNNVSEETSLLGDISQDTNFRYCKSHEESSGKRKHLATQREAVSLLNDFNPVTARLCIGAYQVSTSSVQGLRRPADL
jgi:hypothetical protein